MNKIYIKKILFFILVLSILIGVIYLAKSTDAVFFIKSVGEQNLYLALFIISIFGGLSAGGSITFISSIAFLASAGFHPLIVALVSAAGIIIGDFALFFIAKKFRNLLYGKINKNINFIEKKLKEKKWSKSLIYFFSYVYMGITPFPNDILLISLALLKYPMKIIIPIIIFGDITFTIILAFGSSLGL